MVVGVAAGAFLWQAMAGSPRRYLPSRWPWRCLAYLVTSILIGLALVCVLPLGILFPPALILAALPVGALERRRLRLIDVPADSPHATPSPGLGAWLWLRLRLAEGATWREFGYMLTLTTVLLAADFVSLLVLLACVITFAGPLFVASEGVFRVGPLVTDTISEALALSLLLGPVVTVLGLYGTSAVAGAQGAYTRWLLAPRPAESDRKVEELAGSRTRLVNAFEAERRRIERDLHDGAQQHLVMLSMTLGLARLELDGTDGRAHALVTDAHDQARQALAAIRELIHGIHPQVLTDLGLAAPVGELAERCRVPVEVDIRLDGRLPPETETTAYFVVSESLTNAVKHAAAGKITVTGQLVDGWLVLMVSDDGSGGADPGRGSGLRGLVDRGRGDGWHAGDHQPRRRANHDPDGTPVPLRIVLAEDAVLLRAGLVSLLESFGHTVVAAVGDAPSLLEAARTHAPDLVITDVRMPPGYTDEGLRAAVALRAGDPDAAVLVLSQYTATAYAAELLGPAGSAGVGYLLAR